ncbi:mucin-3A isoform X29 [Hippocampus zosterae]|uniref:mucin-3A isoform X29 n=1 Tax=Hippocampus zosterae TaxID=109293 RepID=UPI00223CA578|nr:mucin-3A isoform X29 [Hippocampus zosterae]
MASSSTAVILAVLLIGLSSTDVPHRIENYNVAENAISTATPDLGGTTDLVGSATTETPDLATTEPAVPGTTEPAGPATTEPAGPATTEAPDLATTEPAGLGTTEPAGPGTTETPDLATTEPAGPATTEQADPGTTEPAGPGTTEPASPATTEPTGPATTEAPDLATTEPAGPATTEAPDLATTEPAGPGTTEPAGPATTETPDLATTEPAGPATTEPAGPGTTEPAGQGTTETPDLATTEPAGPGTTETPDLATTESAGSGTTEPAGPGTTETPDLATTEPPGPGTTEPAGPATTEPAGPATTEPAGPGTTEPAGPGTTETPDLATTEPASPGTTEPAGPATTEAPDLATTEPAGPGTTEPAGPGTTEAPDLATTEPAGPGTTETPDLATTEPAGPATTEPAGPATTEAPDLATTEPAGPATTEGPDLTTTEPAGPATTDPVGPATTEPASPGTTEQLETTAPLSTVPPSSTAEPSSDPIPSPKPTTLAPGTTTTIHCQNGGTLIGGICACISGFHGNACQFLNETISIDHIERLVKIQMVVNQEYNPNYDNTSSAEYRNFVDNFTMEMEKFYREKKVQQLDKVVVTNVSRAASPTLMRRSASALERRRLAVDGTATRRATPQGVNVSHEVVLLIKNDPTSNEAYRDEVDTIDGALQSLINCQTGCPYNVTEKPTVDQTEVNLNTLCNSILDPDVAQHYKAVNLSNTLVCVTRCDQIYGPDFLQCYNDGVCRVSVGVGAICNCKDLGSTWYLGNDCGLPIQKVAFYAGLVATLVCLLVTIAGLTAYVIINKKEQTRKKDIKKKLVNNWISDEIEWSRSEKLSTGTFNAGHLNPTFPYDAPRRTPPMRQHNDSRQSGRSSPAVSMYRLDGAARGNNGSLRPNGFPISDQEMRIQRPQIRSSWDA